MAAANAKRERYFYLLRGRAYSAAKMSTQAREQFKQAQQIGPWDPEVPRQVALMELFAFDKRDTTQLKSALRAAQEACTLSRNQDWSCLLVLAAAHAANGDFDVAAADGKRATAVAGAENRTYCEAQCREIDAKLVPDLPRR